MSNHENAQDIESQRQIQQAAHESRAFEQSDAAKVAAVAALIDPAAEMAYLISGMRFFEESNIRTALADPDAALERVRAEARAEALRDAADVDAIVSRGAVISSRFECHKRQCSCGHPSDDALVLLIASAMRAGIRDLADKERTDA